MWQQIASVIKAPISPHQKPVKWEEGVQNAWKEMTKIGRPGRGFCSYAACCVLYSSEKFC